MIEDFHTEAGAPTPRTAVEMRSLGVQEEEAASETESLRSDFLDSTSLKVFPIGAAVKFGPHQGTVLSILIDPAVFYKIGYWNELDWKQVWVDSFMVTSASPPVKPAAPARRRRFSPPRPRKQSNWNSPRWKPSWRRRRADRRPATG